ncbi:hypothetical protein MXB_2405, partial [Myxobolus squamalis]
MTRIKALDIIYSTNKAEMGIDCGENKYYELKDTYKELQNDLSQQIYFPNSLKLTLRAHIYLAINVKATDSSGSCEHSALTIIKNETLCPVWSQTLFLSDIEYVGMVSKIHDSPPYVIIKLFDMDDGGIYSEIGGTLAKPICKLHTEAYAEPDFPPKLEWYTLYGENEIACNLLCCLELLCHDPDDYLLNLPDDFEKMHAFTKSQRIISIPENIIPKMSLFRLEIFLFGIRSVKTTGGLDVGKIKYMIEFECGQYKLKSSIIEDVKILQNFKLQYQFFDLELPVDENQRPTLSIRILALRSFNRIVLMGVYTFPSMSRSLKFIDPFSLHKVKKGKTQMLENIGFHPETGEEEEILSVHKKFESRFLSMNWKMFLISNDSTSSQENPDSLLFAKFK